MVNRVIIRDQQGRAQWSAGQGRGVRRAVYRVSRSEDRSHQGGGQEAAGRKGVYRVEERGQQGGGQGSLLRGKRTGVIGQCMGSTEK